MKEVFYIKNKKNRKKSEKILKQRKCMLCGRKQNELNEDEAIMSFSKQYNNDKTKTKFLCLSCGLMIGSNSAKISKMIHNPMLELQHLKEQSEKKMNFLNEEIKASEKKTEKKIHESSDVTPKKIYDYISKYVVSQESAKKAVSVAVYKHYQRINNPDKKLGKTNILLTGPSGTGKTEIARRISEFLNLPYVIVDVTGFTEAGFKGNDVENILLQLIAKAGSVKKAETGIIFLDEIDKLAQRDNGGEISHEGVQQALLKIVEGTEVNFQVKNPQGMEQQVKINTENILFVASGAFSELEEDKPKNKIGFNNEEKRKEEKIQQENLIKYGMLPEFIGRFPVIASTNKLKKKDLFEILTNTENSVLKEYQTMFEMEGFSLQITDDSIENIIEETEKLQTGARGLRTTVSNILDEVMFDIPGRNTSGIVKIEDGIAKIKTTEKKEREDE